MRVIKKYWYVIFIVLLAGSFIFWKQTNSISQKANAKQYTTSKTTFKNILTLTGSVDASEKVFMTFAGGGKLTWVGVKEGDSVKKWQGVASVDSRTSVKQSEKVLNNYDITRRNFDQTLQEQNNVQPKNNDAENVKKWTTEKSQFTLDNSVLDVEIARIAEENAYLASPIDGTVTRADGLYPGIFISPSQGYEIVNLDTMYVNASADQTELKDIVVGKQVDVVFDAAPERSVRGVVSFISLKPKQNEAGSVYEVRIAFDRYNLGTMLKLGMTADVNIILSERSEVISVPSTFVKIDNATKKRFVYKQTNNKTIKTSVSIGEVNEGNTEIISGLSPGDVVYDTP